MDAQQRDELMREIAFLKTRESSLKASVADLAESKSVLELEIAQKRAELDELVNSEMVVIKDLLDKFKGAIKE